MTRGMRTAFTIARITVAVGLLAYLGLSGVIEWRALARLVSAWPLTLAAFALMLGCMVVTAWRLCVLMRPRGLELSLFASVKLTLIGILFSLVLPGATGGDAVRFYYATAGNKGRRTEVATILVLDRAAGMFGFLLWPLLAAPLFLGLIRTTPVFASLLAAAGVGAVVMIGMILVAVAPAVREHHLVMRFLRWVPLGSYLERIFDTLHGYRHHLGTLATAAAISLLAHTFAIAVVLVVARALNPDGFSWTMSLLVPLGFMANTLPLTPGGLGVGEAVFDKLFALGGLSGGAEVMLGWRLILLLTGLLGLIAYLRGTDRFVHTGVTPEASSPEPLVPAGTADWSVAAARASGHVARVTAAPQGAKVIPIHSIRSRN